MDISVSTRDSVTVAGVAGDIDGKTAPSFQEGILALVQPGAKVLIDLSGVGFMSSAGLRVMLLLYRQATETQARIVLCGLNEDIRGSMSATGFLKFFTVCDTPESGTKALE